ncbi:apolipoprotein M isoform X2 [Hemicordylus capensis]|uniref:apolipoprotein M isoform X2 n=1 Tax=Hemicordylus capensis TaxID=884348 RepID=UPI002302A17B|nr:apolipoprotein M isoform X2 [Hemicordylus capensis]
MALEMEIPWACLLYLYGLLVNALSLCEAPVKLHANELDRDQYLGRWFFIAAASASPSSLETFTTTDNTVFRMTQSDSPERLQLQAAIQLKTGECMPRSWIYLLKVNSTDMATEGRPHMRTELFSSKCPDSIIVQETDQDYQRILLYSRVLHPAEECIADFKDKAFCLDMDEFLLIPRTQEKKQGREEWKFILTIPLTSVMHTDVCEFQDS